MWTVTALSPGLGIELGAAHALCTAAAHGKEHGLLVLTQREFLSSHTYKFSKTLAQSLKWASLMGQFVKNLHAMRETWVRSLGWEDPLEEGIATHSSILAWRMPMDRGA